MALVRKILETTLTAGTTSVTFTDTDIPNSLLRVYSSRASLFPLSQTLSGNTITVNYKPQDANIGIALEIVKQGLDIVDGLTSQDATKALSANQGYVLKGLIDDIVIPTVPENITDLDDVSVSSIENGQVLAWNSLTEKFENVNQSGGGSSDNYSYSEQAVGTWYDGKTIYKIGYHVTDISLTANQWYNTNIDGSNIESFVKVSITTISDSGSSAYQVCSAGIISNKINLNPPRTFAISNGHVYMTFEYTKKS